jgi:ribosomal protein L29
LSQEDNKKPMTKDLKKKIADLMQKTQDERINLSATVKDTSAAKKRRKEIARILTESNKK